MQFFIRTIGSYFVMYARLQIYIDYVVISLSIQYRKTSLVLNVCIDTMAKEPSLFLKLSKILLSESIYFLITPDKFSSLKVFHLEDIY